jgi:hypothetical protein
MADVTITGLPAAGSAARGDLLAADQTDATTRKITVAQTLAAIDGTDFGTDFDLQGSNFDNGLQTQNAKTGDYTIAQADSFKTLIFAGTGSATWTVPSSLDDGTVVTFHNFSVTVGADLQFAPSNSSIVLKGPTLYEQSDDFRTGSFEVVTSGGVTYAKFSGEVG